MFRTEATITKYVIIVMRDRQLKYVGRKYNPRQNYGYSVKINRAMVFETPEDARRAMEKFGLNGSIGKVKKHLELVEVM